MKAFAIGFLLFASMSSYGSVYNKTSPHEITQIESSLDAEAKVTLTEEEKSLAKQWMLTETDWLKYKRIMEGPRGIWSPGLDPLTALGVSETDPDERARYADIWIKVESRRAELELAFEEERQKAKERVLGDLIAIDNTGWIEEWNRKNTSLRKIIYYFVDADCHKACQEQFRQVYASIGDRSRLEIYFKEGATDQSIGQWAAFMDIDPTIVKDKKVVLNYDNGQAASMSIYPSHLPQVRVKDAKTGDIRKTF